MPTLLKKDLKEKYKWSTSEGDDAHLIHDDAKHLSREEGYEMLLFLNKLGLQNGIFVYGTGSDLTKKGRQKVEWMLKNHFNPLLRGVIQYWPGSMLISQRCRINTRTNLASLAPNRRI